MSIHQKSPFHPCGFDTEIRVPQTLQLSSSYAAIDRQKANAIFSSRSRISTNRPTTLVSKSSDSAIQKYSLCSSTALVPYCLHRTAGICCLHSTDSRIIRKAVRCTILSVEQSYSRISSKSERSDQGWYAMRRAGTGMVVIGDDGTQRRHISRG